MKAIISHDVDHITVSEHYKDLIIPKFIIRSHLEFLKGRISAKELFFRYSDLVKNKWNCINELMDFDKMAGVKSTYFVGVANGLGLSYSLLSAAHWTNEIKSKEFEIGLHGINFSDYEKMKKEHDLFGSISGLKYFGIRIHYAKHFPFTLDHMNKCGYLYDTTTMGFINPYKIGNLWEFPFQIMDGYIIEKNKRWQACSYQEAIEQTKILIDEAFAKELKYFNIIFHDRYFSRSFNTWQKWYYWLIEYLTINDIEMVNYRSAIEDLEKERLMQGTDFYQSHNELL